MQRIRILLGLCLLAALLSLGRTRTVWAGPAKTTVTNVDSIRKFMEKGQELFVAGKYQRSAEVFEAGYELHPYSAFLFNAGVALEKCGKLTDAVERFETYVRVDPNAPDAGEVKKRVARIRQTLEDQRRATDGTAKSPLVDAPAPDVEPATKSVVIIETEPTSAPLRILRRARGESTYVPAGDNPDWVPVLTTGSPATASLDVGHYHVEVQRFEDYNRGDSSFEVQAGHVLQVKVVLSQGEFMGHLRVTSNVNRANIFLDDASQRRAPAGKTPFGDFFPMGEHNVLVTAAGYEPVTRKISLDHGQHLEMHVDLQRLPIGRLRISSNVEGAAVFLDGLSAGSCSKTGTPLELTSVKAGMHRLRVTAEGRKPLEAEVQIPRGQVLPVYARLVVTPPRGAAYTQAIIGGLLLGTGVFLGIESNRTYDDLETDRRNGYLASDDSRRVRGKVFAIGADIAFLGALGLGGLSTYGFLHDPLPPSRLVIHEPVEFDAPSRSSRQPATKGSRSTSGLNSWSLSHLADARTDGEQAEP
jgi:hypothetical protein